ncbi:MAG: DUF4159 domain-containing protein [bacterium]|nr:DUF4159 domain-containing protein [bacterium]
MNWIVRTLAAALLLACFTPGAHAQPDSLVTIGMLKYGGGGDWYSDKTSLSNLLRELRTRLGIPTADKETVIEPGDPDIFNFPMLYMTGHGTVRFTEQEVRLLRQYFERGGFLWADDDYGLHDSFMKEMSRVFPGQELTPLPADHPIFHQYYQFPAGLPKIHEHDGKPPQLFGLYLNGRLAVIYSYESNIGDGMESAGVHPADGPEIRETAMKMGIDVMLFALSN